jgi:hypothetical protein
MPCYLPDLRSRSVLRDAGLGTEVETGVRPDSLAPKARSAGIHDQQRRGGRRVQLALAIEQAALDEPDTPADA